MKMKTIYLSLLFLPIIWMIMMNEFVRLNTTELGYNNQGVTAINTDKKLKKQCSWICHNNTNYCKVNHVLLARPYFSTIDPIYFGIINALKSTGNYGLANIVFLVILLPLSMFIFLIKSIRMEFEIHTIKKGS